MMKNWLRVSVLCGLFALPVRPSIGRRSSRRATSAISPTSSTPPARLNWKRTARTWSVRPARRWRWSRIPTLEGEPIEDVANTIFRAWGVGKKGKDEGILLLLAIGDRRNRLEVGYGLEPIIPDGFAGSVLREMRPALRQQRYGEAMMAAAETIGSTVAKAKNVTITTQLPRRVRQHSKRFDSLAPVIGGIFLLSSFYAEADRAATGAAEAAVSCPG